MLERSGKVLFATGPVRPSDAKLRRAQALAHSSGAALRISRELIRQKLDAQEQVARHKLFDPEPPKRLRDLRPNSTSGQHQFDSVDRIASCPRLLVSMEHVADQFPEKSIPSIPCTLAEFRNASFASDRITPACKQSTKRNSEYLYALLESEARLAAACLGLDPGLGVLHVDTSARDSLACDSWSRSFSS